jgi:transcriptional regulator with XRE-family HTH domain
MDVEAAFRRRLRQLLDERYPSLDRFYLESGFSKGHLGQILRGDRSPSVRTLAKLAKLLDVDLGEFFRFPERPTSRRTSGS